MNVFLATKNGWDGRSIIGIYSTKEIALSNSIAYLLKESISMNEDEILTPINEEIHEDCSAYDITNSDDVLVIRQMEVDK
jgi:hypothetical protein